MVSILFMVFYTEVKDTGAVDLTQYDGSNVKVEDASQFKESFE